MATEPDSPDAAKAKPDPAETSLDPAATQPNGDDAVTRIIPPATPGGTSVLPAVPDDAAEKKRWSARASVPVPTAEPEAGPEEEWGPPPRGLLVPALITICVLLLLALIALGIWLVARGGQGGEPGPGVTTTRPTAARTTTPPATTRPPTQPPTAPQPVPVPGVRNRPADDAMQALRDAGFNPVAQPRSDAEVPAGRAIGTDPAEGTPLAPGSNITVFISTGSPTTAPPPTTTPPTSPPA